MNPRKKKETVQVTELSEPIVVNSSESESNSETRLRASLEEIKDCDGVVGYILKNTSSASIDLKDPARIVDFALVSSTIFDVAEELSKLFDLEEMKSTTVTGKNLKIVSLNLGKNRVSVFLESGSNADKVVEKIQMVQ